MIKRIIFDIDGTIITGIDFYPAICKALQNYGINDMSKAEVFVNNIIEYNKTHSSYERKQYLSFFSDKLGVNLDDNFLSLFFAELKKAVPNDSKRIFDILSSLRDYELVILSNYFEESQRNRLKAMVINDFFTEYHGEKIIKPYSEAYLGAAGPHKPSECIIVGDDKELDIDIPKKMGFNTIWVHREGDISHINELSADLIKKIEKEC